MADVSTDPPRHQAASRNAGAAPAWKKPSSMPPGSSSPPRATATSRSTPSPPAPAPASPCSTGAGRPATSCCAPPSATAAPSRRSPTLDTGTLRGDYLALLRRANTLRSDMAALLSSVLGSYYDQTGLSPADLRNEFLSERPSATDRAIERADRPGRDRPRPADPPHRQPAVRPVAARADDDPQARSRPCAAPDRGRHLHPPGRAPRRAG